MHKLGIMHRDIKPENIILDTSGHLKLCDFGFSKKLKSGEKTYSFCGTIDYLCRDILLSNGHDLSVDYWSLGVLLFELLTGKTPFYHSESSTHKKNILLGIFEVPDYVSKDAKDLICSLFEKDIEKRKKNFKKLESHPWLKDIDWKLAKKKKLTPPNEIQKYEKKIDDDEKEPYYKPLNEMEKKIFLELSKLCEY